MHYRNLLVITVVGQDLQIIMQRTHGGALIKEGVSLLGVQCAGNWVLEGVSFAEFVVVMLRYSKCR
jgi:hypothetical protein